MRAGLAILSLFAVVFCVNGYKFLLFGATTSRSHMVVLGRIADTLADDGHDVTVVMLTHLFTPNFNYTRQRTVEIGKMDQKKADEYNNVRGMQATQVFEGQSYLLTYQGMSKFAASLARSCESALIHNKMDIELLKAEHFDALFVSPMFACGSALSHVLGIKTHFLVNNSPISDHVAVMMGLPLPQGYVPTTNGNIGVPDKMSFLERVENTVESTLSLGYLKTIDYITTVFRAHYGADFPDVREIMKRSPLMFSCANEFIDFPRPKFARDIAIGGVGPTFKKESKSLKEPYLTEVNRGKNGSIFFSLGSNVNTAFLPFSVKKNLIDAFEVFAEYHFIVKLDEEDAEGIAYAKTKKNMFVTHWAPQTELLRQDHLKLFVTHGGYNSVLEVAQMGKPVVLFPVMYDHARNSKSVERNGWGVITDRMTLLTTKDHLVNDMKQVLYNPMYKQAAVRISKLIRSSPFTANELLLKNVRFVMDNGGVLPEWQPASVDMTFVEQFNLDIYALFFALFCVFLFLVLYIVKSLVLMSNFQHKSLKLE